MVKHCNVKQFYKIYQKIATITQKLRHSVEITEIYTYPFLKKISWNRRFSKGVTKELVSRIFFSESEFQVFPHCE